MGKLRVINFHGIGTPQRALEHGEAPYWISTDRFRYMLDKIVSHPEKSKLLITFDDGNISDLTIGIAELVKRDLAAQFFVLTGRIGQPGSLDESHIREMLAAGMTVGSHGIDHKDWSGLDPEGLQIELELSKQRLEQVCGQAISAAAIPFGRYNASVLAAARKAGYVALYSSDGGSMDMRAYLRPRSSVRADTSDSAFDAILDGRMPFTKRLRRAASMRLKHLL